MKRMERNLVVACALGTTLAVALPETAGAQISGSQVRQRYDRQTRGKSIEDFVRRLNGDDPKSRLEAVKSLEDSKDPKAIDYLVQALGDADIRIKVKAIDALGNVRAAEASPVLVQHLFLHSTSPAVERRILASLGKIGDPSATDSIVEFMRRDLDTKTLGTAIFALGEIGSPGAVPALERVSKNGTDATLQRCAREALAKVRHHQAVVRTEAREPQATFLEPDHPRGNK